MRERIGRGFKKYKNKLIIVIILWVLLTIVFVSPLAVSVHEAMQQEGYFDTKIFIETAGTVIMHPLNTLGMSFSATYIASFWGTLWKFTFLYIIIMAIGIARAVPRTEYGDIEHGSSDWSENGEQYKLLDRKKGILLAEKVYLPTDKRGNTNVLVVGRFGFW